MRQLLLIIIYIIFFVPSISWSEGKYPFYFGIISGYASTKWGGLVPSKENQNIAMSMSTPISVDEGGIGYGFFIGYTFLPQFSAELSYQRYPDATIFFDQMSLFAFENNGLTSFTSETESISLMGKIFLIVPKTKARFFSGFGIATMHRKDQIVDGWRLNPSFSVGINYPFSQQIISEFGCQYIGGYGESELDPSKNYFPFLYSVFFNLSYHF